MTSKEQQDLLDRIASWQLLGKSVQVSRERIEELHRRSVAGEVSADEMDDELLACATDVIEHTDEAQ